MMRQKFVQQLGDLYFEKEIKVSELKEEQRLISIVIPVYNEEKSIKSVIKRISNNYKCEIIVVDDGSNDNSVSEVLKIKNKNISLIRHARNKGYGASIIDGINHAKGDIIITMDSDGQHNPEEISALIQPIIENIADITVGSRYKGKSNYKIPFHTRTGEFMVYKALSILFHQSIKNNQSGFRAFSKKCISLFKDLMFSKFGVCTEILFKAAQKNIRIKEVPVIINKRNYGCSYVKLTEIIKSIGSLLILYFLKKIKIGRLIPKKFWSGLYLNFVQHLKKLY